MKYSTLAWLVIASYTVFAQDGTSVTGYTTTIVIPGSPPAGAGTAHGGTENTGTVHTTEHLTGTEVNTYNWCYTRNNNYCCSNHYP